MLWNWYTIDSCFISKSWHVTSAGMFAGSCIGVILLVMALEFLRRSVTEYDRYLARAHREAIAANAEAQAQARPESPGGKTADGSGDSTPIVMTAAAAGGCGGRGFRPNVL